MTTAVLIVAAGRGTRAATEPAALPKQYQQIAGVTVLARTVQAFVAEVRVHLIQVVIHPADERLYEQSLGPLLHRCRAPVLGRETRQGSVLAGLEALAGANPRRVLIHDAARPLVSSAVIDNVLDALATSQGAIAALPVTDTLRRTTTECLAADIVDRTGLWAAQTPQGFAFDDILAAHRRAATEGRRDFTDDAALAQWAGMSVKLVTGSPRNIKLTTPADFDMLEAALAGRERPAVGVDVRTGTGFDVHRFATGDTVWLCGVAVPHTHKLEGHSDADVALHALTDAILGALGDGDIGHHFPPSDPQWKGAASHQFLRDAVRRAAKRGARITNADITILCEAPKIGPHRETMRATVAAILGIEIARVGVKATTTEGLGFTGRREGIAAMATATLVFGG